MLIEKQNATRIYYKILICGSSVSRSNLSSTAALEPNTAVKSFIKKSLIRSRYNLETVGDARTHLFRWCHILNARHFVWRRIKK